MQCISSSNFPDAASIASLLDLDISGARITKAKSGMSINGARVNQSENEVSIVCGTAPGREIWYLPGDCSIPYKDVKGEVFGDNQRVVPSKADAGLGVLCEIGGLTCGYTASSPDGTLDGFFAKSSN